MWCVGVRCLVCGVWCVCGWAIFPSFIYKSILGSNVQVDVVVIVVVAGICNV